jgi:hypothetical protein
MYEKFRKNIKDWLKEHTIANDSINDWFLGEHLQPQVKTTYVKESCLKKTPYHIYYRYKVVQQPPHLAIDSTQQSSKNNSSSSSNSKSTTESNSNNQSSNDQTTKINQFNLESTSSK